MKKIFASFLLLFFVFYFLWAFSFDDFLETKLYYIDSDFNWKIDKFEIEFNYDLTWSLDFQKIFLYSNTWWLSVQKLDWVNNIFKSYSLSWNILTIDLFEQDNYLTWLVVNNSTSSHLRLKTNAWVWIKDFSWKEIKFLYGTSFSNYSTVFYKEYPIENENSNDSWENSESNNEENNDNSWSWSLWENENSTDSWESSESNNEENNDNSWSWSLWETQTWFFLDLPNSLDVLNIFQSPTYLISQWEWFYCDQSKTDCKSNFN